MVKFLIICAIAAIGSGCCSVPVDPAIGLPDRPDLIDIADEGAWGRTPLEIQDTVIHNDLALKQYARELESRISLHDEALTD